LSKETFRKGLIKLFFEKKTLLKKPFFGKESYGKETISKETTLKCDLFF